MHFALALVVPWNDAYLTAHKFKGVDGALILPWHARASFWLED